MSKDKKEIKKAVGEVEEVLTPEVSVAAPEINEQDPVGEATTQDSGEQLEQEEVITKVDKPSGKAASKAPAKTSGKTQTKAEQSKVEAQSQETVKESPSDPVLDFEIDPNKNYEFRLRVESFRYTIPSTSVAYDETDGTPREIRLTDTGDSPFTDDQPEHLKTSKKTLSFVKGKLTLKGTEAPAIRYLLAYDGFSGKKEVLPSNRTVRGLYELFIPEEAEKAKLDLEMAKIKAKNMIVEASDEDVSEFIVAVKNSVLSGDFARTEALALCDKNPDLVLKGFDNPVLKIKSKLIKATLSGLIAVVSGKIVGPTGSVLFAATDKDVLLDGAKEIASNSAKGQHLLDVIASV